MSNRRNIQFTYTPHNKATVLDCSFIVDSTNGNGFGVRSLKPSGRVGKVFMNTSAAITGTVATTAAQITSIAQGTGSLTIGTPVQGTGIPVGTTITNIISSSAVGISATPTGNHSSESITYQAAGSPNPAAGLILVQLQDNYNSYLGGYGGPVSPVSGTPINVTTGVTAGTAYVIASLGTTTAAQWAVLGVPLNITPAVGVGFVAPLTTTATGTGVIETTVYSGFDHFEVIGDANLANSNGANILGAGQGMQIILACYSAGSIAAPVNGTAIGLNFYLNDSAQGV